jgi:dimethylpropiothetin dethiomethylase
MSETIENSPDLGYYLRDLARHYRLASAGGSRPIRGHMKIARETLNKALRGVPEIREAAPERRPVCRHFARAVDNGVPGPGENMLRALARFEALLCWSYGYDRLPARLKEAFAFAEILGPRGPAVSDEPVAGVVLLAPDTVYPRHSHHDVTESYVVLSGALSQNDAGVYVPGSLIYNPPNHGHRLTTGGEPCLLSYIWTGPPEALADQKMRFDSR